MLKIIKSTRFSFVAAGSAKGWEFLEEDLTAYYRPRFGRCWWFWIPEFRSNGGKFKANEVTDMSLLWLCFSASLTVYSWGN